MIDKIDTLEYRNREDLMKIIRLLASWVNECPTTEHRFECPLLGDEPDCADCQIHYALKIIDGEISKLPPIEIGGIP